MLDSITIAGIYENAKRIAEKQDTYPDIYTRPNPIDLNFYI